MESQNISRAFKTRQNVKFCRDGIALDVMDYLVKNREKSVVPSYIKAV